MEKLSLLYNGSKVIYHRSENGARSIMLPVSMDESGEYVRNIIEYDSMGWKISTRPMNQDEVTSSVWITNEGDIAYKEPQDNEVKWLGEKIDPDKQTDNEVYQRAQILYDVLHSTVNQIVAYENAPWTPEQVIELRKKQLVSYIKMLGYESLEAIAKREEPNGKYASLTRVGHRLEDYSSLSFIKNDELAIFGQSNFVIDIPEFSYQEERQSEDGEADEKIKTSAEVIDEYSKLIDKTEAEFEEDLLFLKEKDEFIGRSRGIVDDYFVGMEKRVPREDWQKYYGTVLRTARLVMELNYDIIPAELRAGLVDCSRLSKAEIADRISDLIDSRDFGIASDIENRYATAETERLEAAITDIQVGEETFTKGELAKSLKELRDEALKTRTEKKQKMDAYSEMEKIMNAKQIIIPHNPEFKDGE